MAEVKDERVKQATIGAVILLTIAILVPSALLGWRLLPGLWGEWLGTLAGLLTTPFVMETSFVILGLLIVVSINHRRRMKDGDDFVFLEQVDDTNVPNHLPDQAKWALYRDKPENLIPLTLLEKAEGAFAIGEYNSASLMISEMELSELKQRDTLVLRMALAKATGKMDLFAALEQEVGGKLAKDQG